MSLCVGLEVGIEGAIYVVTEQEELGRWEMVNEQRERIKS